LIPPHLTPLSLPVCQVLQLLWSLAHSDDCPTDTLDQALAALIKILDYSCSQERDEHKIRWIHKFVDELKVGAGGGFCRSSSQFLFYFQSFSVTG